MAYYWMNYNHSLTEEMAKQYDLPVYIGVDFNEKPDKIGEDDPGPDWLFGGINYENSLPEEIYIHTTAKKWDLDFYSTPSNLLMSKALYQLFAQQVQSKYRSAFVKDIFGKKGQSIKTDDYYFIQFTEAIEAFDLENMGFDGTYRDIIAGENLYKQEDEGVQILRSDRVVFKPSLPPIFATCEVNNWGRIFCDQTFKDACEKMSNKGLFFTPIEELIVVDFFLYNMEDTYQDHVSQFINKSQRNKWKAPVIRDEFVDLSIEHLLSDDSILDDDGKENLRKFLVDNNIDPPSTD